MVTPEGFLVVDCDKLKNTPIAVLVDAFQHLYAIVNTEIYTDARKVELIKTVLESLQ